MLIQLELPLQTAEMQFGKALSLLLFIEEDPLKYLLIVFDNQILVSTIAIDKYTRRCKTIDKGEVE